MAERQFVGVKLGLVGVEWLDGVAEHMTLGSGISTNRSDVIRAALIVARGHEDEVRAILRGRL